MIKKRRLSKWSLAVTGWQYKKLIFIFSEKPKYFYDSF